jgi:two-component system NarL family response regulator
VEQALRASEERFRLLAENAKHVIFRLQLSPERRFDYISPFVTTMTGYTPAEFYADPELHFKVVHPASRPLLLELKDVADHTVHTVILRYKHKEGHEIWVEQDQWAIYDQEGQRIAFEGVIRDITQRKLAEQQVTAQQEALTILKEREHLARELHDNLGQVLGYINLHAQGIRDLLTEGNEKEASHLTEQIIQVSQSTFTDVREYLLGVQVQTKKQNLAPNLDNQKIFFATLEAYLHDYSVFAGLKATLQLLPDQQQLALSPTVETHLLRIIQEALSNVRKYAQATQVKVEFTLIAQPEAPDSNLTWLAVTIQDDGQGFDLANTPHHLPGHGYGMESMRSRAAECGGTLTIESAPKQGTCVTVQLPLSKEQLVSVPPIRVLLADDSTLFLSGMANLLTRQGFQVVGTADNGEEAVVQAIRLQPDIILMDIHMPGGSGLEATRLIKQNLPECQIVMLTVSEDEEHLFTAIKNGAAGYLLKNLDSAKLVALLRGLSQGEVPLAPGMASKILQEFAHMDAHLQAPESYNAPNLSNYEVEILKMVAEGSTYQLIGDTMHFSERTVKRYVNAIVKKLRLKSRIEAIEYVRQKGLIP